VSSGPSLYRRHRPRTFEDVVGQEHVVRTLRNAVERGQVHHAYLFVGSRGTGKTSMAKILAACLNCERGPTVEPCGTCESCLAIASATSLDVIEMDAASNNSVDDIRDLRERVAYAPVSGRHKVYILDEAHMLSTQAWNAFLKTLEEPPPSTIFVLATTDVQKVPATVIDRCHRFDFGRPTMDQIAGVVRRAAATEGIELPDHAVALIARAATGSFRDALGILEQLLTYGGPTISVEDVLAVLGVTGPELLLEAADAVAQRNPQKALFVVSRLAESGRDPGTFLRDLEGHARNLLVVQTLGGEVPAEISLTPDEDARLAEQAEHVARADVIRLLDLIAAALAAVKDGGDARTQVELALVKAAAPQDDVALPALLARLDRLEAAVGAGGPETAAPAEPERERLAPGSSENGTDSTSAQASAALEPYRAVGATAAGGAAVAAVAIAEPAEEAPSAAPAAAAELEFAGIAQMWPAALEAIRVDNSLLAAVLVDARPLTLDGGRLVLGFPPSAAFLRKKAEDRANQAAIAEALRAVCGQRIGIGFDWREEEEGAPPTVSSEEEWIERFKEEFDAEELSDEPSGAKERSG
jgi:DNA polymerase-3 subunit gamma/tau